MSYGLSFITIRDANAGRLAREGGLHNEPDSRACDEPLFRGPHDTPFEAVLVELVDGCNCGIAGGFSDALPPGCPHESFCGMEPVAEVMVVDVHHADGCGRHPGCWCMSTGQALRLHDAGCPAHDVDARNYCRPGAKAGMWHWTCEPIEQDTP